MSAPIEHKCGTSPLQWFLAEIDRVPDGQLTGAKVRALLGEMVGLRITVSRGEIERLERIRQAEVMLRNGLRPTELRSRLPIRFGVSRDTAERIVSAALARAVRRGDR